MSMPQANIQNTLAQYGQLYNKAAQQGDFQSMQQYHNAANQLRQQNGMATYYDSNTDGKQPTTYTNGNVSITQQMSPKPQPQGTGSPNTTGNQYSSLYPVPNAMQQQQAQPTSSSGGAPDLNSMLIQALQNKYNYGTSSAQDQQQMAQQNQNIYNQLNSLGYKDLANNIGSNVPYAQAQAYVNNYLQNQQPSFSDQLQNQLMSKMDPNGQDAQMYMQLAQQMANQTAGQQQSLLNNQINYLNSSKANAAQAIANQLAGDKSTLEDQSFMNALNAHQSAADRGMSNSPMFMDDQDVRLGLDRQKSLANLEANAANQTDQSNAQFAQQLADAQNQLAQVNPALLAQQNFMNLWNAQQDRVANNYRFYGTLLDNALKYDKPTQDAVLQNQTSANNNYLTNLVSYMNNQNNNQTSYLNNQTNNQTTLQKTQMDNATSLTKDQWDNATKLSMNSADNNVKMATVQQQLAIDAQRINQTTADANTKNLLTEADQQYKTAQSYLNLASYTTDPDLKKQYTTLAQQALDAMGVIHANINNALSPTSTGGGSAIQAK